MQFATNIIHMLATSIGRFLWLNALYISHSIFCSVQLMFGKYSSCAFMIIIHWPNKRQAVLSVSYTHKFRFRLPKKKASTGFIFVLIPGKVILKLPTWNAYTHRLFIGWARFFVSVGWAKPKTDIQHYHTADHNERCISINTKCNKQIITTDSTPIRNFGVFIAWPNQSNAFLSKAADTHRSKGRRGR